MREATTKGETSVLQAVAPVQSKSARAHSLRHVLGASCSYSTDITRTWPLSGKFTPLQKTAYNIVLAAQTAGIDRYRTTETWVNATTASSDALLEVRRRYRPPDRPPARLPSPSITCRLTDQHQSSSFRGPGPLERWPGQWHHA